MKARLHRFSSTTIGDRKGQQAAPAVNANDVRRVVERDFPPESQELVFAILAEFRPDQGETAARIHLAALKLAGGDVDRLIAQIAVATHDWRDVVTAAEYPAYAKQRSPKSLSSERRQEIIQADWNQYHEWLGK